MRSDQQRLGDPRTTVLVPEAIIPHETGRRPRWGLWLATLLLGMVVGVVLAWSFGMKPTKADGEVASAIAAPPPPMPPRSPYPAELPDLFAHSAPLPAPTQPPIVAPMPEPPPVAVEPSVPPSLAAPRRVAPVAAAKVESRRPVPPPEPAATPARPVPQRAPPQKARAPLTAPTSRPAAVDHPIAAPRPARSLSGPLGGLFLPGDYPALARRARDQGDVTVRLNIGTDGRVARCAILASNASRTLEMATCAVLSSRARLAPATDSRGSPVSDSIVQHIAWRLP